MKINRRNLIRASVASVFMASMSDDAESQVGRNAPTRPVKMDFVHIGSGGAVVNIVIANDGTKLCHMDVAEAYIWVPPQKQWVPLFTTTNNPVALAGISSGGGGTSAWEVAICPTDSRRLYAFNVGYFLVSSDRGRTWQSTSLPRDQTFAGSTNCNGSYKQVRQKIAVDPNNPDVVYAWFGDAQGLFFSEDSGRTYKNLSTSSPVTIPAGTAPGPGGGGIAFDGGSWIDRVWQPSRTISVNGKIRTADVYLSSWGNGVYHSSDGGQTWNQISNGTNRTPLHVTVGKCAPWDISKGFKSRYFCAQTDVAGRKTGMKYQDVWRYDGGSAWHAFGHPQVGTVAIDPHVPGRIVMPGGFPTAGKITLDAGKTMPITWFGPYVNSPAGTPDHPWGCASTDVPWLASGNWVNAPATDGTPDEAAFDPTQENVLYIATGVGPVWINWPNAARAIQVNVQSAGMNDLVVASLITTPKANIITCNWDRAVVPTNDPNVYPSYYAPHSFSNAALADWASTDPDFVAFNGAPFDFQYSTDGGLTFTPFNKWMGSVTSVKKSPNGNYVRAVVSSTKGLTTWENGKGSLIRGIGFNPLTGWQGIGIVRVVDSVTVDLPNIRFAGVNWSAAGGAAFDANYPLINYEGKLAITNVINNGNGTIRIVTAGNPQQCMTNDQYIEISAVRGSIEANGRWISTNVTPTSFDLKYSKFNDASRYEGGGSAFTHIRRGGAIAVQSSKDMMIIDGGHNRPLYTRDGGQTWKQSNIPANVAEGWIWAYYLYSKCLAADRVLENIYYAANQNAFLISIDFGANFRTKYARPPVAGYPQFGNQRRLRCSPYDYRKSGWTSDVWYTAGPGQGPTSVLCNSVDQGSTWRTIANTTNVNDFDFGAPRVPGGYPTVFFYGQLNGVAGVYMSEDRGLTWKQLTGKWPNPNRCQPAYWIAGDMTTFGKFYVGHSTGASYGSLT